MVKKKPVSSRSAVRPTARNAAPARGSKPARREAPKKRREIVEEPEVAETQTRVVLNYVAETTGQRISVTETHYDVDGVSILRSQVVAVVGKTIYHRVGLDLGILQESEINKGKECITTDSTKVVVFDPTSFSMVMTAGEAAEEVDPEDEDFDPDADPEDEEPEDEGFDPEEEPEDEEPEPPRGKAKGKGRKAAEPEDDDEDPDFNF